MLDDRGQIDTEVKIQGITQEKTFVRFTVMEDITSNSAKRSLQAAVRQSAGKTNP